MKNKKIVIAAFVFFLLVNTGYFWGGELGLWAIPLFTLLAVIFLLLAAVLFRQICFTVREKFKDKRRIIDIVLLTLMLTLIFFKPDGMIDFDRLQGENLLVAGREGGGNCTTTLILKSNSAFRYESICFGITVDKGDYRLRNDTIFFENINLSRNSSAFYKFAVIQRESPVLGNSSWLVFSRETADSDHYFLGITKNELDKLNDLSK